MSTSEIYLWGIVTGVAISQAFRNTLWIIRFYRDRRAAPGVDSTRGGEHDAG